MKSLRKGINDWGKQSGSHSERGQVLRIIETRLDEAFEQLEKNQFCLTAYEFVAHTCEVVEDCELYFEKSDVREELCLKKNA